MSTVFQQRSLDDWYKTVNRIYLDRNFYRDRFSIFAHLVEILGGLSLLGSPKSKPGVTPKEFLPKAIAWWMALCGKVGIRSIEDMLWQKFPGVCSYCHLPTHNNDKCKDIKKVSPGPDWKELASIGREIEKNALIPLVNGKACLLTSIRLLEQRIIPQQWQDLPKN